MVFIKKTSNKAALLLPHDREAVPKGAEALVDVVRLLLPCAGRPGPRASAALAAGEVDDPQRRVLALLADELDLTSCHVMSVMSGSCHVVEMNG